MKVALVHDYLREFGGAERVLKVLTEMYPKAPIYTAFSVKGSTAQKEFRNTEIIESWLAPLLKIAKLYSPLRFLTPIVWGSMDLSNYDLVITSCSWYITRGFKVGPKTRVVAYCHTPPRWLYGFETSVGFTKYWPVKVYARVVGYFMKKYDFRVSRAINYWIANSRNVKERIWQFYNKKSVVIYPPVDVEKIAKVAKSIRKSEQKYFLVVSRLVGAKGLESIVEAFGDQSMAKYKLKIVGEAHGVSDTARAIKNLGINVKNIEFLGRVSDQKLYELYAGALGLICLAKQEDFGMTPVEAMAAGTPVIAFGGGGYRESVIGGKTGLFVNNTKQTTIIVATHKLAKMSWSGEVIKKRALKFSKSRFINEFKSYLAQVLAK